MEMYRTTSYDIEIKNFEVEKATEKTIWFINSLGKQGRELRKTDSYQWHETKQSAIDFLLKKHIEEKHRIEGNLARINAKIEALKAL
jgi:hypothetical protein